MVWRTDLAEVDDDLKSRYQAAQQAQLTFSLSVPEKGTVSVSAYIRVQVLKAGVWGREREVRRREECAEGV